MKKRVLLTGAVAGAALAYFFDPVSGGRRRAQLRDRSAATGRRVADEVSQRARYESGRLKGVAYSVIRDGKDVPADDAELLQKVRSEAVGPSSFSTSEVDIRVQDGEVTLMGSAPSTEAVEDLVERVKNVTGVENVDNQMVTV